MVVGSARFVTPEAVELRFETASLGSRALAAVIDLLLQGSTLLVGMIGVSALVGSAGGGATAGVVLALLLTTAVLLGYPIAFETLWRGRTPGKAVLGLRVVTREGAPVRFRHAAVRGFLTLVDIWLTSGAAAVVAVLVTPHDQRLGDLAAGTLVLRERTGAAAPEPVAFAPPAGLEGYASRLDVAGLGGEEYAAVRAFLLRAPRLPDDVRASLAAQLAGTVASRLRHVPPPEVSPADFLACVAAARQRRSEGAPPASTPSATPTAGAAATAPLPRRDEGDGPFAPPG